MKILEKNKKVDLSRLEFWDKNPREAKKADIERLKKQITKYGPYKDLITYEGGGRYVVVGGNMRLKAMREMGITATEITVVEFKDENEKIGLSLSDNDRVGYYIKDLLAEQIAGADIDLSMYKVDLKVPDVDLGVIKDGYERRGAYDDDIPDVDRKRLKTKPGDLYTLGNHRILCGDAGNPEHLKRLLDGARARCCFTDPPYGVDYTGHRKKREKLKNDNLIEFTNKYKTWIKNIIDFTDGGIYICFSIQNIEMAKRFFIEQGGNFSTFVIWVKNRFVINWGDYNYAYEPIIYGWPARLKDHYFVPDASKDNVWDDLSKIQTKYNKQARETLITVSGFKIRLEGKVKGSIQKSKNKIDLWRFDSPVNSKLHPTMKPVALCIEGINNSSERGDNVLDPFTGSGSTIIACEKQARNCYAMDIDPLYVETAVTRWEKLTGLKAKKEK